MIACLSFGIKTAVITASFSADKDYRPSTSGTLHRQILISYDRIK